MHSNKSGHDAIIDAAMKAEDHLNIQCAMWRRKGVATPVQDDMRMSGAVGPQISSALREAVGVDGRRDAAMCSG